ncbi:MAG: mechanosensitive ion channel family protein [Candidatus Adiutrix sp.]|jgi:small-conductance mechanosensitive channel|nr:mechanosensitive ion channel family protein [Candidatus Adiutrix sp.]
MTLTLNALYGRLIRLAAAAFLLLMPPGLAAWPALAEEAAPADVPDNIQKTIDILEDEERRAEVVRLLKLMAVINNETASAETAAGDQAAVVTENLSVGGAGMSGAAVWLRSRASGAFRQLQSAGSGFNQSRETFQEVLAVLVRPETVRMWQPYILKIFIWGLVCLLAAKAVIGRYGGALPKFKPIFRSRLLAVCRYLAIMAGPNLILIASFLAIPPPSAAASGITANMAIGFSFFYALAQHFFVNFSLLYIGLRMADVLFARNNDDLAVIDLPPALARHFLGSWRFLVIYLAVYVFIKETFLENFTSEALYALILGFMVVPAPIYLTFRLKKLKRLVQAARGAEVLAGDDFSADGLTEDEDGATGPTQAPAVDYRADLFFQAHWPSLAVVCVWGASLVFILNPVSASNRFVYCLLGSFAVMAAGVLAVKLQRAVMSRLVERGQEQGRRLLLTTDALTNILVWLVVFATILSIWGAPLGAIIENQVISEIVSRGFAIAVVVTVLAVFIRFSRLATEWLLSVPGFTQNRNWRTVTPLLLTAARALAVFVGTVVILERLGVNIGPILAGAGILGLGVGMGAQSLVKDLINGISILLMDTLSVGDYVSIGGRSGTVEEVGLRTIRLRDSSGNLVVVPNSSVTDIVNMTRDYSQDLIDLVVPYDADPEAMMELAAEAAAELDQDPKWKEHLIAPTRLVGVTAFDADGTTIRLSISTSAGQQWAVGRELRLRLKKALLRAGIKSTCFGQNLFLFKGRKVDDQAATRKRNSDAGAESAR